MYILLGFGSFHYIIVYTVHACMHACMPLYVSITPCEKNITLSESEVGLHLKVLHLGGTMLTVQCAAALLCQQ